MQCKKPEMMANNFPSDFLDFLHSFNDNQVDYILVEGFQ